MFTLLIALCAQALLQSVSAQCIGAYNGLAYGDGCGCGWGADAWPGIGGYFDSAWNVPFANGLGPAGLAASNGAGLAVTSASPITPTGVSMTSENAYEGLLAVTGAIPFLGVVALEGALPTIGAGAVAYGCGNGNVAMISEDIGYDGLAASFGIAGPLGLGYDGLGYGIGGVGYDGLGYGIGGLGYDGLGYGIGGLGCNGLVGAYGIGAYDGLGYGYDGLGLGYGYGGCGGCGGWY